MMQRGQSSGQRNHAQGSRHSSRGIRLISLADTSLLLPPDRSLVVPVHQTAAVGKVITGINFR
jgi:hypothetical protein